MCVKDYMQAIMITVSPNDSLSAARRLMDALYIRHLPVVAERNHLVGLLTDRDIRQMDASSEPQPTANKRYDALENMCVGDVMTREVYTVTPETALTEAAATLVERKFDCLPVIDDHGALQGILTVSDFARLYIDEHHKASV